MTNHAQVAYYRYQDIIYLEIYKAQPENTPLPVSEVADFPIWVVTPGWRLARLSEIGKAANASEATIHPENAGVLLTQAKVVWSQNEIDPMGVWGWKGPLKTWPLEGTGDFLVFWLQG